MKKQAPVTEKNAESRRVVVQNSRERHEYAIGDVYEAGIALSG